MIAKENICCSSKKRGATPIDQPLDCLGCMIFEYTGQISHHVIFNSVMETKLTITSQGIKFTTFSNLYITPLTQISMSALQHKNKNALRVKIRLSIYGCLFNVNIQFMISQVS